jgi:hypothetical protein
VAWLQAKIKRNAFFVPNHVQLANVLEKEKDDYEGAFRAYTNRINATKDSNRLEDAWHDLFDFCKRTKSNRERHELGIELGRKAYAAAEKRMNAEGVPSVKEMLTKVVNSFSEFAPAGPMSAPAIQGSSEPLKPGPFEVAGRVTTGPQLPEEYSWVQAQLSGVRTLTQYLREGKAVEEFIRILPQINPHESQVVVERIRQLSEIFEGFSRTESHDRDGRRLLYNRANGLAQELQGLIARGAMSQQFANLIKPYANMIDQVVGDLSKQASILPAVQATIENPFVSLDTDSFLLIVRITNDSDRPVTEVSANLILQTPLFSYGGVSERRIDRLAPRASELIGFPIRTQNVRTQEAKATTRASFAVSLRASAEGFENIDLGMKSQEVPLVSNLQAAIGIEQIPKLFQPGRPLRHDSRELFHLGYAHEEHPAR